VNYGFPQKLLIIIVALYNLASAQSFGFGCLGFVGGYGGFTYQQFDAKGLNDQAHLFNQLNNPSYKMEKFSYSTGYRVGLNFFRASFPGGLIITAKGFYQSLGKKNKASYENEEGSVNTEWDLDLKNWSVGLDLGWEFTSVLSWKILDGAVNFNNVSLGETRDYPGGNTEVTKYKSNTGVIGYSVGTGIIIAIIKEYISIEGSAGYSYISIDDIKNDQEISFGEDVVIPANIQAPQDNKFLDTGGFTAVVQLNVGFPL
jgi:hypothetical protein